ncbi:MAG: radical SAM protein [Lachnospiraceae bacterium]|nr:radical SAM protein [Lachnospiraceae bacterium]
MKNLNKDYYNPFFSHIYVEKSVQNHPRAQRILQRFPYANVILIDHYKDVFCRKGQNFILQQRSPNLILGAKQGNLVYKGAPVCQSFGNENFYYASCIMNCVYNCEYCYLKGMYPSGNLVVFVNLEDLFDEVRERLKEHAVYLCISYDTDLLAMEQLTGYVQEWISFTEEQNNLSKALTVEIRTKSADRLFWQRHAPTPGIIYALTLSPQAVIEAYEHQTPPLHQRIASAGEAVQKGFRVRLCFDPMIYCQNWELHYEEMLKQVFREIDMDKIEDVSVGTFRVSQDYLKKMRKNQPNSAVVQFPYQNDRGVYHYPKELTERMERFLVDNLRDKTAEDKIFLWKTD